MTHAYNILLRHVGKNIHLFQWENKGDKCTLYIYSLEVINQVIRNIVSKMILGMSSFWCGKSCRDFIRSGFTFVRLPCLGIVITFIVRWLGRTTRGVVVHWRCACVGIKIVGQCAINLLWWYTMSIFRTSLSYNLDRSSKSQFPMLRTCDYDWYTRTTSALWSVDRIFNRSWSCIWNRAYC